MKIRGLTLDRPWSSAFLEGPAELRKRIENRSWPIPAGLLGHFVALHSGKKYRPADREFIEDRLGVSIPGEAEAQHSCIFAVGILAGQVTSDRDPRLDDIQRGWYSGPFAWLLSELVPLVVPVHCSGARGLWPLDPGLLESVRRAYLDSAVGAPVEPLDREFRLTQPRLLSLRGWESGR